MISGPVHFFVYFLPGLAVAGVTTQLHGKERSLSALAGSINSIK